MFNRVRFPFHTKLRISWLWNFKRTLVFFFFFSDDFYLRLYTKLFSLNLNSIFFLSIAIIWLDIFDFDIFKLFTQIIIKKKKKIVFEVQNIIYYCANKCLKSSVKCVSVYTYVWTRQCVLVLLILQLIIIIRSEIRRILDFDIALLLIIWNELA